MGKTRLEAFSDGVFAIIITVMVLELKVPGEPTLQALRLLLPSVLGYLLSFIYLTIYWNNHHHMFHASSRIDGRVMWANAHLLFWLSLVPIATGWLGRYPERAWPVAVYGGTLLLPAVAYVLLERAIIAVNGRSSLLAVAVRGRWKEWVSISFYVIAIAVAFVRPWVSELLYLAVAMVWAAPDPRIARAIAAHRGD